MLEHPNNARDQAALERHHAFEFWEVSVLNKGQWNKYMRDTLGQSLPAFAPAETAKLANSYDFVAFDAYTSAWVSALNESEKCGADSDYYPSCVVTSNENSKGKLIGRPTESSWNFRANDTIFTGLTYMHNHGIKAFTGVLLL